MKGYFTLRGAIASCIPPTMAATSGEEARSFCTTALLTGATVDVAISHSLSQPHHKFDPDLRGPVRQGSTNGFRHHGGYFTAALLCGGAEVGGGGGVGARPDLLNLPGARGGDSPCLGVIASDAWIRGVDLATESSTNLEVLP